MKCNLCSFHFFHIFHSTSPHLSNGRPTLSKVHIVGCWHCRNNHCWRPECQRPRLPPRVENVDVNRISDVVKDNRRQDHPRKPRPTTSRGAMFMQLPNKRDDSTCPSCPAKSKQCNLAKLLKSLNMGTHGTFLSAH